MSERQWTEGPWVATEVYRDEIGWPAVDVMAPSSWPECPVATVRGRTAQEAIANAHLAAVAPDLYDALQRLVETFEQIVPLNPDQVDYDAYKRAIDALRKARGETNE